MNSNFRVRLTAFAERLSGPLGNVPLDRAIRADLELFRVLRESGATWPQIASALAAAGARRPDGSISSADHVRSAVTRQLKRTPPIEGQQVPPAPLGRHQPSRLPKSAPAATRINPASHFTVEPAETRPRSAEEPGKASSRTAAAGSLDGPRKLSIQEKLERTRKLRES